NRTLQAMYRHYKIETFYEQIRKWRLKSPLGGLSTDIIVGFPGETEEDFLATMKLLEDLRFDQVYSFAYSPRPGTKAFKLADDVPDDVKHERLLRFQKRAMEIAEENNQRHIGRVMEVLVEGRSKVMKNARSDKNVYGRTACGRVVNFPYDGPRDLTGQFVQVRVERATGLALTAVIPTDA
ncbi:MAG: TRAM domain-containing protein, partial [Deltaproteobacteria bacterium]|nr:TRAM domain-containing protein [Deltaproteobacteria bacterium]